MNDIFEKIYTGEFIKKNLDTGKFEIINGGKKPLGYTNDYNCEKAITVARVGSSAGYVNFIENKFWLSNSCMALINPIKSIANQKYVLYYLKNNSLKLKSLTTDGALPSINLSDLRKLKIKLPSLETQNKIVEILDTFDTMCNNLKIGLPVEEARRQQQYEYYRNLIFDKLSDKNN
ncbi:restriction endonuclease subunit S [Mycoplasma sp. 1232]|uniref:restriction endonuclease subunit S n=1 Tax=Mycoplasma sp. 1232 TaxID=3108527 RepID=UPI002B259645|nr:restriction endonuclease subunit S [Mycoplasma sp. 1232]MEA4333434.1 restriction endonuclease subunit S [Mycoplasma sp. 1232]